MQTHWTPTNVFSHRLLDTAGSGARQQLFIDLFVEPSKPMLAMMGASSGAGEDNDRAGARPCPCRLPAAGEMANTVAGRSLA
jgi:hypothetical protein